MSSIKLPVNIKTAHYKTETVDFYYPRVFYPRNLALEQKINWEILSALLNILANLSYLDMKTNILGSYEIKTNERHVLSITLSGTGDFQGAHPINSIKSLSIDVETGEVAELKDLFKANSDYVTKLSEIGKEELKKQNVELYDEFKEIRPDQDYYIADSNLVVFFQQYEIGPRPTGFPHFNVPVYDIQDIIDENGLLGKVAGFY